MQTKKCSKCGDVKDIIEFYKNKSKSNGVDGTCKQCFLNQRKEYYNTNKESILEKAREYSKSDFRKYKARINSIKKYFDISEDQVRLMLDNQKGCCAICGDSLVFPDSIKAYCVDHCHETNKIRGLLCSLCNTGIGALGDTLEDLKNAVKYLEGK